MGTNEATMVGAILVSGLINLETNLRVDSFPIPYQPVRYPFFGVESTAAGVGFNVAKALHMLGDTVRLLSLVGADEPGELARRSLERAGIPTAYILDYPGATAQSAILVDGNGKRQINLDLKSIQESEYPREQFEEARHGCELAVLCNINFSRPMLALARERGLAVATDVHAIADPDDRYNRDFMAAADILFQSDESLPCTPEEWVRQLWDRYGTPVAVVGLGARGALLGVREGRILERLPAVYTRPVVNTIGAGDALFSAFLHFYRLAGDPFSALQSAILFASWKIGESGAANGFLSEAGVKGLIR